MGGFSSDVECYVVAPAQADRYKVGMLRILEVRQMAQDELGDRFNFLTCFLCRPLESLWESG